VSAGASIVRETGRGAVDLAERARIADGKKTRMGMIYAILAAPSLGLAFGLLSVVVGKWPFNLQAPTGGFAIVALLQVPFGVIAIAIFSVVSGTWREPIRLLGHPVSWWSLFVAVGGFVGDLCFAIASGLIGGALGGAIGGLAGVVGAVIAGILYREKILRWSTIVGLACLGVGVYLAVSGGTITAPTHGIYLVVGLCVMFVAVLTWGFETFAISAGTDLLPAEGFLWWRAFLELILANGLLFVLFPMARKMAVDVWTDPQLLAFGGVIGFGWAIWMIMGYYIGVSYAGAVRGGVLTNTLAFFFIAFFSLTVYGEPFSAVVVVGTVVMAIGALFIVSEPIKYIARRRGR
jgi:drug/metabolite transporter (DMT)-like permease